MKKFWSKLKGWQKGGYIGIIIGLIISILLFIIDSPSNYTINNLFFGYILPLFFMFILPITLIGISIGFLTSLKNKFIWIFAFIGGLFGFVTAFLVSINYGGNIGFFIIPIVYLVKLIFGVRNLEISSIMIFMVLFMSFIIYALIGFLIGFLIGKIKEVKE